MALRRDGTSGGTNTLFDRADKYEADGDLRNAFRCMMIAAKRGDSWGQVNLGNFYASGKGVRRNSKKASYWYKKAYANGNRSGAFNLGVDRRNGGNIKSAVTWFKRAVAMNDGNACIALARIYGTRRSGRRAAVGLLKRALQMRRDDISEAAKEEAESLLKVIS